MNIFTKKATQPFGGSLESRFETFRTLTTLATVEGKRDRLGVFLSAGISTSDNVTDEERKVVDPTGVPVFDRSLSLRTWYGGARVVF